MRVTVGYRVPCAGVLDRSTVGRSGSVQARYSNRIEHQTASVITAGRVLAGSFAPLPREILARPMIDFLSSSCRVVNWKRGLASAGIWSLASSHRKSVVRSTAANRDGPNESPSSCRRSTS